MKLITGALITAVLLAGCSSESAEISLPINKSPEIKLAITEACASLKTVSLDGLTLMNENVALKFNEIAKLDSSYNNIAEDAFTILTIMAGWKRGISNNQELQAAQVMASARIIQFCAVNS